MSGYTGGATVRAFTTGEAITAAGVELYMATDGTVLMCDSPSVDPVIGTAQATAASGATVDVSMIGPIVLKTCGGVVTAGYPVSPTTNGVIQNSSLGSDGDMSSGIALEAGTTGAQIEIVQHYFYNANVSKLLHGGS